MELGSVVKGLPIPSKASFRLHALCVFFGLASFVWGYNIGVMGTIYVHPGFKKALNKPDASKKGLITAIYYLGTWISYIFISHPIADILGRRWAAFTGVFVTCIGAAFQAGARPGSGALAMMIIGRIICGLGLAVVSTSVPLYQSEIAPAKQRGRYVVMNHVGLVAGLAVAFWVGYAFSGWTTSNGNFYGWRLSLMVQYIPAVIFFVGIPFCPETPRWLVQKGQIHQAQKSLAYLRDADLSSDIVTMELEEIRASVEAHKAAPESKWTSLFTHRPLFNRLWRAALLQFMAQMCGNTSMKYYLPTIFASLGIEHRLTLLIGGIESTLKIGCTIIDMVLIDRAGRRSTLIVGCVVMAIALLINGALPLAYPNNENRASDYACIVFIFFYTFGYSIGFGPAAWVYGAEIFPTNLRARGLNFAASGGSIGSIIVAQVWPVGMDTIGSKTYFFFMAINIISGIIVYFFYPETKRKSLEEMDAVFGDHRIAHLLNPPEDTTYDSPTENITVRPKNSGVGT
ncbi:MFS general substrate transporter [Venustampulla echinocandica]|uniref:MFS general substrate transporter n=1 Tax=Venustampulla echinocandica TaxID=2656787 RepID=A0A370U1J3_9HELO|nr:MFS general substrate transporter [Venustampulla echinocandica]RDL41652.1 MFS general substrate transporter [Venustampulla echinocandica]